MAPARAVKQKGKAAAPSRGKPKDRTPAKAVARSGTAPSTKAPQATKTATAPVNTGARGAGQASARTGATGRAWQAKLGGSTVYRSFACGGHLLFWTGSDVKSLEASSGRAVGKAKADNGAPWISGDEVWIPTTKGFEVRTPALAAARTIAVAPPKGLQFRGAAAHVHGNVAYRVARTAKTTNVDGALVQEYFLYAFDLKAKQQRFLTSLQSTAYSQVHGACSADQFAIEFRTDKGFEIVWGSAITGAIAGRASVDQSQINLAGARLIQHGSRTPQVLRDGAWKALGCEGEVRQIGDHVYCIGHREIARLDDALTVVARAAIATPASPEDATRHPSASACVVDGTLVVIERTEPIPAKLEQTSKYRCVRRDPRTLAERGAATEFEEAPWLQLVGYAGGLFVADAVGGFVGLRLA